MEPIDFAALENFVYENRLLNENSVHGLLHWHQVEANGLLLSRETLADATVVRLFALFHDSRRVSDGYDEEHGEVGAEFAKSLVGKIFHLDADRLGKLLHACANHTTEHSSGDLTIDTCYDADRLDLGRVMIIPDPERMATPFGKRLAQKMRNVPPENHRDWIRNFAEGNFGRRG